MITSEELRQRTKAFALRIIKLSESMPKSQASYVIAKQVLRAGTSVAANYRAACRARSRAEFISKLGVVKLGVVVEEIDETLFWLELIVDAHLLPSSRMKAIIDEANQLTSIFVAARKTSRSR
ncbi:MAG TPA: four helix bundle protein [Terriglobales bacterium]|jgi:four helix bundle protein|nr:four helix bundle protein [Terriglobales bacterium]